MSDFETARFNMVESQVRTNDVTDVRIQDAMRSVPRERFVPKSKAGLAYAEDVIEIAPDRYLMDPRCFSKLIQALAIKDSDTMLVIGCGLGYAAAICAHLCQVVVGLESEEELARQASQTIDSLSIDTAAIVTGALGAGYPKQGPYDVILIDGGIETLPAALEEQLSEDGRLGAIMLENRLGKARIYTKTGGTLSYRVAFDATIPLLPGFERAADFVF